MPPTPVTQKTRRRLFFRWRSQADPFRAETVYQTMISKPVPPAPAAPAAFAASAAVLLAGRSPKTSRVAGGAPSLPPLPVLDVSEYIRDVLTFTIDNKTKPDEVPVYYDKATKEGVYIHNMRGMLVLCGVEPGTVKTAVSTLLKTNPEIRKVILKLFLTLANPMLTLANPLQTLANTLLTLANPRLTIANPIENAVFQNFTFYNNNMSLYYPTGDGICRPGILLTTKDLAKDGGDYCLWAHESNLVLEDARRG